jgi:hypothetical protein
MRIEWLPAIGGYWLVTLDADELVVASGRKVPYPFYLGTIRERRGRAILRTWTPAASVPRGYKAAATAAMHNALEALLTSAGVSAEEQARLASLKAKRGRKEGGAS